MNNEKLLELLTDADETGGINAECIACGDEIRCESDALKAWCHNCDKIVIVKGLVYMGVI